MMIWQSRSLRKQNRRRLPKAIVQAKNPQHCVISQLIVYLCTPMLSADLRIHRSVNLDHPHQLYLDQWERLPQLLFQPLLVDCQL